MNFQSKKVKAEAVIDDEVVTGFRLLRKFTQKVRDFFLSFLVKYSFSMEEGILNLAARLPYTL